MRNDVIRCAASLIREQASLRLVQKKTAREAVASWLMNFRDSCDNTASRAACTWIAATILDEASVDSDGNIHLPHWLSEVLLALENSGLLEAALEGESGIVMKLQEPVVIVYEPLMTLTRAAWGADYSWRCASEEAERLDEMAAE